MLEKCGPNYNPNCERYCEKFAQAKRMDETFDASGFAILGPLNIAFYKPSHNALRQVEKETAGCPGPKKAEQPNNSLVHKLFGIGPEMVDVYVCSAPKPQSQR